MLSISMHVQAIMAEAGQQGVLLVSLGTIAELGMLFASGIAGAVMNICEWNSRLAVVKHRRCRGHELCRVDEPADCMDGAHAS